MTESLKIAEIHRTNIEYERQRHLANWLIKSGPHMAKPTTSATTITTTPPKLNKNGTITQNPIFFLGKTATAAAATTAAANVSTNQNSLSMSRSGIFNSQTNLPLQIVTSQDGHKPKLRRFNSHDTSANMFSVADFENARLARRNELEIKQRQQNRYKMNSLSSGGDCSTGDSKGSKFSSDSHPETLPADVFLDRFSLPRVVRVSTKINFSDETMQSNSSNGSNISSTTGNNTNSSKQNNKQSEIARTNGELYLLFRNIKNRRMFHGINAKNSATRKKGVIIPQEFQGFFSLVNERGAATATMYTTLVQLVRERVYKFLSVDNLAVYSESSSTDNLSSRPHYVKGTARGGQIFRLLAVFEDGKQDPNQSNNTSFREKDKGRYAQLLNENRQIVYVSLTTKGKFYEIEPSTPQILQKSMSDSMATGSSVAVATAATAAAASSTNGKPLNPDCVHRISNLITTETEIPMTLRFIAGPQGTSGAVPENVTITKVTAEHIVIACPIEEPETRSNLVLKKLILSPEMLFIKSFLGFENEQKMFANPSIQNILKFCQMNYDNFMRMVDQESIAIIKNGSTTGIKHRSDGLKILKPLNFPKLLRREKSIIAHEREDSIIFLSKSDLENLENKEQQQQQQHQEGQADAMNKDKMKVFQSTKKKWFRNLKPASKANSLTSFDLDIQSKRMSLDRYQDMSKLLQERFGNDSTLETSTNVEYHGRPSSEIGSEPIRSIDPADLRQKSMSLQEMDSRDYNEKPDLLRVGVAGCSTYNGKNTSNVEYNTQKDDDIQLADASFISFSNQQSFISEKLYNEFHVKTKQHSKSSASLQHLLHFSVPQKMNVSETKKKFNQKSQKPEKTENGQNEPSSIPAVLDDYVDDLPYSNVRDSLVLETSETGVGGGMTISQRRNTSGSDNFENIYAEICPNGSSTSTSGEYHLVNGSSSAAESPETGINRTLRISIYADDDNSSSSGCSPKQTKTDNLYNSLRY